MAVVSLYKACIESHALSRRTPTASSVWPLSRSGICASADGPREPSDLVTAKPAQYLAHGSRRTADNVAPPQEALPSDARSRDARRNPPEAAMPPRLNSSTCRCSLHIPPSPPPCERIPTVLCLCRSTKCPCLLRAADPWTAGPNAAWPAPEVQPNGLPSRPQASQFFKLGWWSPPAPPPPRVAADDTPTSANRR